MKRYWDVANAYNEQSIVYFDFAKYDEAIERANKALEYHLKNTDNNKEDFRPTIYINIGNAYLKIDSLDKALKYYQKALKIAPDLFDIQTVSLNNIGIIYRQKNQYAKARVSFEQSIAIIQQYYDAKTHPELGGIYDNIGDIYFDQKDYQTAIQYYHMAIQQIIPEFRNDTSIYKNPNLDDMQVLGSPGRIADFSFFQGQDIQTIKRKIREPKWTSNGLSNLQNCR